MKKQITIKPDRVIKLKYGDEVRIYASKSKLHFSVLCDGAGSEFDLTKEELEELMK